MASWIYYLYILAWSNLSKASGMNNPSRKKKRKKKHPIWICLHRYLYPVHTHQIPLNIRIDIYLFRESTKNTTRYLHSHGQMGHLAVKKWHGPFQFMYLRFILCPLWVSELSLTKTLCGSSSSLCSLGISNKYHQHTGGVPATPFAICLPLVGGIK